MADDFLVALTTTLAGVILATASLAGAYLFRRFHELRDRVRDLEAKMDRLQPIMDQLDQGFAKAAGRLAASITKRRR